MTSSGWRSRGYIPHCDETGLVQHIVFGLDDAMPQSPPPEIFDPLHRAEWADRALDRNIGSRLLQRTANAEIVQSSLLHDDRSLYALAAWCVMPTHVHVMVELFPGARLEGIVQSWKSVTAHRINALEKRNGRLWRREYFDRFMRSEEQYLWTVEYIERNPVTAGLAASPEDWTFSSAHWRRG